MLLQQYEDPGVGGDNSMHSRDEGVKDQIHHKAKPDPIYDKAHPKNH
ncbi:MAG: hypothetical protein Q7J47_18140 [Azoarcus sp.]|nr:hypothetical protein [Azoarcus sp.]